MQSLIGIILVLLGFFCNICFAAGQASSTTISPPPVTQPTTCVYNFQDTYYSTDSGTNPPTAPYQLVSYSNPVNEPGFYGPTVQLQFNNYNNAYTPSQYTVGYGSPTQYTPNVPCTGHYEVSFTVELRNNSGVNCNSGLNSMSIWSTTTDPASPNAYGCPVGYVDGSGHVTSSYTPGQSTPNQACATFSQWVQCAWTNNYSYNKFGPPYIAGTYLYYGVHVFPMYMYEPYWAAFNQYDGKNLSSQYPGQCPYGCGGWTSDFMNGMSYQTAFCTSKPYYFKNVVYLHAGAQISAPAMVSQMVLNPWNVSTGGYAQCSFSVIGGKFKVVYLGP